jgi:L-threonylcarbamoyladenylate synthase
MTAIIDRNDLDRAVDALRGGRLVAFPTETVYGLGADASNSSAVGRVFVAKGRPAGHPLIVHVADSSALDAWAVEVDRRAWLLADTFWPGPLTLVLRRSDRVAPEVVGGRDTVGLRVPDHPVTLELLRRFGGGVAGPSANRFGHVSPTTARHVADDLDGSVDLIIDGGPARVGVESTIIEVVDDWVTLLRPGGVTAAEVEDVLGQRVVDGRGGESRASGMLTSHYAPRAPVTLWDGDRTLFTRDTVVVSAGGFEHDGHVIELPSDAAGFAGGLYAALRRADALGAEHIMIKPPIEGPLLPAVLDRLAKAAAPRQ